MGGRASGEVAATLAVEGLRREVRRASWQGAPGDGASAASALAAAMERVCASVHEASQADPARAGMGCTLTALWVLGPVAVMGHVGDSRLYVWRGAELAQVSRDHTMAAEVSGSAMWAELEEGQRRRLRSVLTRSVGTHASVAVDTLVLETLPGDGFLLCSDGVTRAYAGAVEVLGGLTRHPRHVQPAGLVAEAVERDGRDNATAVLVWMREEEADEASSQRERATDVERRLGALARTFLLDGLDLGELAAVLQACEAVKVPRGARVLEAGQRCEQLVIPVYGRLALVPPRGGVVEVGPSSVLGASTLLCPRPARCGVRALEPTRYLVLTRQRFEALVQARPALGVALLTRLARHLSEALDGEGEARSPHRLL